jgi:hypothetical protein
MNKARRRLFYAAIVRRRFALASKSASLVAAARQWQEGVDWSGREGGDFKNFRDDRLVSPAFAT